MMVKTLPLDPSFKCIRMVYPAGLSGIKKVYPVDKNQGLTLIELMLAVAISLVVGGVSLTLTKVGLDSWKIQGEKNEALETSRALLERILRELRQATAIYTAEPNNITFTIPDHNGDLQPETINFLWSGVIGTPVYRTENGLNQEIWAENVQALNFAYKNVTRYITTENYYSYDIDSVMDNFTGYDPLLYPEAQITDRDISLLKWSCETFNIGNSTRLKSVTLRVKGDFNPASSFYVEIRTLTSPGSTPVPTNTILAQVRVTQSMLNPSNFSDVTLNIPVNNLNPNLSYCIVIRGVGDVAGKVRYQVITGPASNPKGPDDGHGFLYSDNGGVTWLPGLLKDRYLYDCFFMVYGTETETTVTTTTTPVQVIESVEVELRGSEQDESVWLDSEVKLPNI